MNDVIRITSRQNPALKRVLSLSGTKGRAAENAFFTEGVKLWREAVSAGFVPQEAWISDSYKGERVTAGTVYSVPDEVYSKISEQSSPEGLLCVFDRFELAPQRDSCVLLLEEMQDPGNLGTVLRSAVAFGCREVVGVCCCDLFSPKTVRASMGAVFKMPYRAFDTLDGALEYLEGRSLFAAALTDTATEIDKLDLSRACIMIGNEGHGLSQKALEKSDKQIIIPIENIESLNASTAASVILYEAMRGRR